MFLNLHTAKFYCLPDNYEVVDPSLDDILYQLNPTFVQSDIDEIVKYEKSVERLPPRIATDGAKYWTGLIGLNNIKHNDYINVVIQALGQVPQIRNYFLDKTFQGNKMTSDRVMLRRWGNLKIFKYSKLKF